MSNVYNLLLKEYLRVLFVVLIYGVTLSWSQHDAEFHFSKVALKMPSNSGRKVERLTWFTLPHLYEKDSIYISICLETRTIIDIKNISYSNDGASDTVLVAIDGTPIGKFDSHGDSDWGRLWDTKNSSGFIGRSGMLNAGIHNISIHVNGSGDCYGLELWALKVSVFAAFDHSTFWCGSQYRLAPRKWECLSDSDRQALAISASTTTVPPTTTTLPPTYVNVTQMSFKTDCLDKRNVNIKFTTKDIAGMIITVREDNVPAVSNSENLTNIEPRYCDTDIWQIGAVNGDNREFPAIYPGKSLTINITDVGNPEEKFPAKLLPFVTTDITIHFSLPPDIRMEKGSAFLALGLFNLTKPADIGLRYYDHALNAFSDIHIMRFTPQYQVMGWSIPQLGNDAKVSGNTIHLHFQSEANVIMFDFLKLQYNKRDERKFSSVISKHGKWRVKGQRYATTEGMRVVVDDLQEGLNMDDVLLLYQISEFSRFETVLRIHSNGLMFPYKTYPVSANVAEQMMIDVSGMFLPSNNDPSSAVSPTPIHSLHIDTTNDAITVNYIDGSSLYLLLTATTQATKIQIIKLQTLSVRRSTNNAQHVVFTSTYVNKYYAGVNNLFTDGIEKNIMENLNDVSGRYSFTFKRTSPNTLFYANNLFEIEFPR